MCRVLIVDDNADATDTLALLLKSTLKGIHLRKAYSPEEALRMMDDQPAEVVLMDLIMPGMDGWSLGKQFQERYGCNVVILSGLVDTNAKTRSHQEGFKHHIAKPADPEHLAHLIIEMCQ